MKKEHLHRDLNDTVVNNSHYHFKSQIEKVENINVQYYYLTVLYSISGPQRKKKIKYLKI